MLRMVLRSISPSPLLAVFLLGSAGPLMAADPIESWNPSMAQQPVSGVDPCAQLALLPMHQRPEWLRAHPECGSAPAAGQDRSPQANVNATPASNGPASNGGGAPVAPPVVVNPPAPPVPELLECDCIPVDQIDPQVLKDLADSFEDMVNSFEP